MRSRTVDAVQIGRRALRAGDVVRFVGGGMTWRGRDGLSARFRYAGRHRITGLLVRGPRTFACCRPIEQGGLLGENRIELIDGPPLKNRELGTVWKPSRVVRPRG